MSEEKLITEIPLIQRYAARREDENWRFRTYVKHRLKMEDDQLDAVVQETTDAVWSQIDCTRCAQCCRTLQVVVDHQDAARLAKRLNMSASEFKRRYMKFDEHKEGYFAASPCPFLKENACSVYEDRPKACRDFPYLHEPKFRTRMITFIENTALCPIVYNTCERLKTRLQFRRPNAKREKSG
jgi:Fe-S-cluster containining protein